jgi:hypothetical protein
MPNVATSKWLQPMLEEALNRGWGPEEMLPLFLKTMYSAEELDNPAVDAMNTLIDSPDVQLFSQDWVWLGQELRHELGWDDTYPAHPE